MKLLFIRHGDPDYEHDTLTAKGRVEAQALADIIESYGISQVYQSPLGRAQATAAYSLEKLGMQATTLDWLQEFPALADPNLSEDVRSAFATELKVDPVTGEYEKRIVWDMLPSYFGSHPELFDKNKWRESALVKASNMAEVYDYVTGSFEVFLREHGYSKKGLAFEVTKGNGDTIALFCHYGITAVLLSWLWDVSPFVPLQFMVMVPTAVTEVVTEEREKGIATFRMMRLGDIGHLKRAGEPASFSARFCEQFENVEERH